MMRLDAESRAVLVERLIASLHVTSANVDLAWAEESRRRFDDLASGRVKSITVDELLADD